MRFLEAVDQRYVSDLERIGREWLETVCELSPEHASKLGFEEFQSRLSDNSPDTHRRRIALNERTLAAIENLPAQAFRGDAWLDRRGFLALLRTERLFERDLTRWRTNPQRHCDAAMDAIFDLLVRNASHPARVLPAIEARLRLIPDYLEAGIECLRKPVPLWTSLAERSCAGSVEFLEGIEGELAAVSENPARTRRLLRSAARAFTQYASAAARKRQGPPGGYAIGRERFEFLIRERLGLDMSLSEARRCGERHVARISYLLEKAAAKHGKRSAGEILEMSAAQWSPERPLLEAYKETTAQIRRRLKSLNLVTLPRGESLDVMPVPPFLKHQFPTAAYTAPPPFAKRQGGIFWVNDLSLGMAEGAARDAEVRQHFGLELTSVHEAYPGHHLQFVVQFQHPSRLRRLFEHSIFYEGWTMWCEHLAVEHGIASSPVAKLVQLRDSLWRAHRILIDCGLQDGSLTPEAAARALCKGVGFTPARAKGDIHWYTSSPTVPMSYLLGRIEVEKLHRWLCGGERWSLRQFNDWVLSHGALPWSWIWQARLEH